VHTSVGEGHGRQHISYAELYQKVLQCAEAMKASGIQEGDRVAAYIPNCAEAVIAMLAATSMGAIWR
jgi:acetoacetyl-CoA synthetase